LTGLSPAYPEKEKYIFIIEILISRIQDIKKMQIRQKPAHGKNLTLFKSQNKNILNLMYLL